MRLIDADALKKVMIETLEALLKNPKMDNQEAHLLAAFHTVGKMIDDAPTVDAVERKRGRWIHDGYDIPHGVDWMHCSVCGRREPHVPAAMTDFCPSCGAEMRGENNG